MFKRNVDHIGTRSEKGEFSSRLYLIFEFLQSTGEIIKRFIPVTASTKTLLFDTELFIYYLL